MFKKILWFVLPAFVFSCKMPNSSSVEPKSILEKYPYWNVELKFEATDKNWPFRKENKEAAVRYMALMKLIVNTEEFEHDVLNYNGNFYSHWGGSVDGGKWNILENEKSSKPLDKQRLLEVIRAAKFTSIYSVSNGSDWGVFGDMGELSYAYHGYRDYRIGARIYVPRNDNWMQKWFNHSVGGGLIFHEHLHNLGYYHIAGDGGVPYGVGDILKFLAYRITGEEGKKADLKDKYGKDLEELTNYYLKLYEDELKFDTTANNSRSYAPSLKNVVMTCSH